MQHNVIGKIAKVIGDRMSMSALSEAKGWYETLLDHEFRGRKDTDGAARYRLARRLGLSEPKLFRLQYKYEEMRDVAGETYRRLMLAYDDLCQSIEDAADAMRAERMKLKDQQDETARSRLGLATGKAVADAAAAQGEKLKDVGDGASGEMGGARQ